MHRFFPKNLSAETDRGQKQQNSPKRNCTVCKKKPIQVQCLHCAEHVCLECAQQHVNLVAQESDVAVHLLNEKIDILDRIAADTRQRIVAERDKIVQQADAERDRSFTLLTQMIEEEKQQIRNKSKELNELPLNEIPLFIRQLQSQLHLTDKSDSLFNLNSSMPRITLQRRKEQANARATGVQMPSRMFDEDDEDMHRSTRPSTRGKNNPKKTLATRFNSLTRANDDEGLNFYDDQPPAEDPDEAITIDDDMWSN